ncbi:MAG TPA: hypothetical protein VHB21_04675, partial [Minicystis sp.]|nr:hypothetical protein [Minicystis sp.]
MFIPVVRRSVEARVRHVFPIPFSCPACGLHTTAHVQAEGIGGASSAYVAADEHAARRRAFESA